MKNHITIMFLCGILVVGLIPFQAEAFSARDNPRTLEIDGISFEFTTAARLSPTYSSLTLPDNMGAYQADSRCSMCSEVEFIEKTDEDVIHNELWNAWIGHGRFFTGSISSEWYERIQSSNIPSFRG
jgi:hypothetical protein